jgi:hypothetical protein
VAISNALNRTDRWRKGEFTFSAELLIWNMVSDLRPGCVPRRLPVLRPWNWTGTMPPDFLNFWLIENRLWDFLAFIIA